MLKSWSTVLREASFQLQYHDKPRRQRIFANRRRNDRQLLHGLVVRIPGFHPGGPGSIPGVGKYWHCWFSGRILACHAGGPGSIPGQCSFTGLEIRDAHLACKRADTQTSFYQISLQTPSCHLGIVQKSFKRYLFSRSVNVCLSSNERADNFHLTSQEIQYSFTATSDWV